MDPLLIDQIYEAAVMPKFWPAVLNRVADLVRARGALLIAQQPSGTHWIASPRIETDLDDYFALGWGNDPTRVTALYEEMHPGFRAETYYVDMAELAKMPAHAEFMAPRGYGAGAGTVIQGMADSALHMGVEGFAEPNGAEAAVPLLDQLRPHICRAFGLTAMMQRSRDDAVVLALDRIGIGAAVIGPDGQCRTMNDAFGKRFAKLLGQRGRTMIFLRAHLQNQFAAALEHFRSGRQSSRSIAVKGDETQPAFAVHLVPLQRQARDRLGSDGILMLTGDRSNISIPNADLLRILYDLTPAEARLARALMDGQTLSEAAKGSRVSLETMRSHLRALFSKTGVRRQTDLVRLLSGLAA